jgi:hypothetical protein
MMGNMKAARQTRWDNESGADGERAQKASKLLLFLVWREFF